MKNNILVSPVEYENGEWVWSVTLNGDLLYIGDTRESALYEARFIKAVLDEKGA